MGRRVENFNVLYVHGDTGAGSYGYVLGATNISTEWMMVTMEDNQYRQGTIDPDPANAIGRWNEGGFTTQLRGSGDVTDVSSGVSIMQNFYLAPLLRACGFGLSFGAASGNMSSFSMMLTANPNDEAASIGTEGDGHYSLDYVDWFTGRAKLRMANMIGSCKLNFIADAIATADWTWKGTFNAEEASITRALPTKATFPTSGVAWRGAFNEAYIKLYDTNFSTAVTSITDGVKEIVFDVNNSIELPKDMTVQYAHESGAFIDREVLITLKIRQNDKVSVRTGSAYTIYDFFQDYAAASLGYTPYADMSGIRVSFTVGKSTWNKCDISCNMRMTQKVDRVFENGIGYWLLQCRMDTNDFLNLKFYK